MSEWVECSETVSGRTIWYNRDTLMVTFEDPLSRTAGSRVRGASILKQSIAREDLEVEAIPEALLRFGSQRWDFGNDHVAVFRAQSSRIDHRQLLPNPDEVVFPAFYSNHTIPRKEVFVARILPLFLPMEPIWNLEIWLIQDKYTLNVLTQYSLKSILEF